MKRPLQLYLDSSDYSAFGTVLEGCAPRDVEARYRELQALIKSGDVVCRYSVLHVAEAAPTQQDYVERASLRFMVMRELSGKNVFQGPFDLAIQDVLSAYIDDESPSSRPADRKRFHARNDDGQWLPFLDGQFAEIQRDVRRILQSRLKHALKNDPDTARLAQNP